MRKKAVTIIIITLVLLVLVLLIARRKAQLRKAPAYGERAVPVRVAEVEQGPFSVEHDYLAVVEAWKKASISSRIAARVLAVPLDEGDTVQSSELLIQLDQQDLWEESKAVQSQIEAAQSTITSLETNLDFWSKENERDSGLARQGALDQATADATKNRLAGARAKLDAARDNAKSLNHRLKIIEAKLTYTCLTSPFDGLITSRDVDPGDLATPGKLLMVVEDHSRLKLAFDAPQEDFDFLKEGLPVHTRVSGKEFSLRITHIYPSFDRTRMVRVEAAVSPDSGFRIGAFVPLSVVAVYHENAVTVPGESLLENSDGAVAVFVVKEGKLEVRPVKKIMESGGKAEVEGVNPGEQVVTSTFLGWATLASGLKVEVIR